MVSYVFLGVIFLPFVQFETMLIDKIQMIDKSHILVRYGARPVYRSGDLQLRNTVPRSSTQRRQQKREIHLDVNKLLPIYVLYDYTKQKIRRIFERESSELYNMMRYHCDALRDAFNHYTKYPSSSPSNNMTYRMALDKYIINMVISMEFLIFRILIHCYPL